MRQKRAQLIPAAPVAREGSVFQAILRQFWKNLVGLVSSARIQRRTKRMEVLDRVAIGAKQSVLLLRLDGQEFVVGCSGENLVLLGTREFSAEGATPVQEVLAQEVKAVRKPRKKRALNVRTPTAAELLREFQGSIQ